MEISIARGHGDPYRALTYERRLIKGRAAEQQDAADEVRSYRWRPSLLILVLGIRLETPWMTE